MTGPDSSGNVLRMRAARIVLSVVSLALVGAAAPPGRPAPTSSDPKVSRIDIEIAIDPDHHALHETASLRVESPTAVSRLAFALDERLAVAGVRTSAGIAEAHQAGGETVVFLDPPLSGSRTLTFTIKGEPHPPSAIGPRYAVLAPEGGWYPSLPDTWATAAVTVRLPAGWTAVGPGTASAAPPAGSARFETSRPVRSVAVAAAPGLVVTRGSLIRTPFVLAAPENGPSAKDAAARLGPPMAWFSGALAPYPFDGFTLALLPGFTGRVRGSGIMIAGAGTPLATASDGADLLAGQWFGEYVAGDGAWIDAFAAWEACVFASDRALPIPAAIAADRAAYFALRSGDVPLSRAEPTTPEAVLRGKGSAAPDMVRLIAGNRPVFDAMRAIFAAPIGPPITLEAIRRAVEKEAGRSLREVFDEWFERAGAPDIRATLRSFPAAGGGFRADVKLVQESGVYVLPVQIVIHGAGAERRETVEIDAPTTSVRYVVPFEPRRLTLDPLNRIFRRP